MSQNESEWEKRFDSMFDLDRYGDSHIVQEKVKSFIRGVVFQREKEIAEEIKRRKGDDDAYPIWNDTLDDIVSFILNHK